jgi:hypothetical protein
LIYIYFFIILEKLLRNKLKINTVSRIIDIIIVIYLVIVILNILLSLFWSDLDYSLPPELGLLFLGFIIVKIALGLTLIAFGYKLNRLKNNTYGLEAFGIIMIISGVLYVLSGLHFSASAFPGVQDLLISTMFSRLFLKASKDTEKPVIEAQNTSTHLEFHSHSPNDP